MTGQVQRSTSAAYCDTLMDIDWEGIKSRDITRLFLIITDPYKT